MSWAVYQLSDQDLDFCREVAIYRHKINQDLGWSRQSLTESIKIGLCGAVGELAVSQLFGIEWEGAKLDIPTYREWRKTKADIGPFEVKTTSNPNNPLRLRDKDIVNSWANAILAYYNKSQSSVQLLGWLPVNDYQIGTYHSDWQVWQIDQNKLRHIDNLWSFKTKLDERRKTDCVINLPYVEFKLICD